MNRQILLCLYYSGYLGKERPVSKTAYSISMTFVIKWKINLVKHRSPSFLPCIM